LESPEINARQYAFAAVSGIQFFFIVTDSFSFGNIYIDYFA